MRLLGSLKVHVSHWGEKKTDHDLLQQPVRAAVLESTILRTLSPHIAPSAAASLGLSGTALVGTPPVDTASRGSYDFGGDVNGQRETGAASYP
jgi:hypothetical protein